MAIASYADRVQETTATTGTGTVTLAGAVSGFQSFTTAFGANVTVNYCITSGTAWEVGQGVFTNSGTTLTRPTANVMAGSSGVGANITLSGTSNVFVVSPAQVIGFEDAGITQSQVALLKWYGLNNVGTTFTVGGGGGTPQYCCFDGQNVWVTDSTNGNVTKIVAQTGSITTITVGTTPYGCCFDGFNVWVVNNAGTVSKITASSGSVAGTVSSVGTNPRRCCFDGTYVWVACLSSANLKVIAASGTSVTATYSFASTSPWAICYDNNGYIWFTDSAHSAVYKVNASTGASVASYSVGSTPKGVCFDGRHIWVTSASTGANLYKLDALTGNSLGNFNMGGSTILEDCCYDGAGNIWVTDSNSSGSKVYQVQASTGALLNTFSTGGGATGVCFDGNYIWTANDSGSSASKL